jgi:hypothetical protein
LPDERTCHLDAAHNGKSTSQALADLGFHGQIVRTGIPPPIQAIKSWPSERSTSWMNGYGKLRRMTGRNPPSSSSTPTSPRSSSPANSSSGPASPYRWHTDIRWDTDMV